MLYEDQLKRFEADPWPRPTSILKIGQAPVDPSLARPQLAATAVLANAMMNLDEFVTER